MKICLIKTSSMGDVIHTLPALTDALKMVPNLQVDWVVEEAFAEIPLWHAAVKRVIPIALRRWRKNLFSPQTWKQWKAFQQALRLEEYDVVIDAQGLLKSALFATAFVKGEKHGYDCRSAREGVSAFFYHKTHKISYNQHAVERVRQLFAVSLGYVLPDNKGDYEIATVLQAGRKTENFANSPYVFAVHATTRDNKHWSETSWLALFELLAKQGIKVRLTWGNEAEKARAERFALAASNVCVLPKMSLSGVAMEIVSAQAVVSVDTGLSHLTAALGVPNVVLYGATDPKLIGAYGKNQQYIQASSMGDISPSQVLDSLTPFLQNLRQT